MNPIRALERAGERRRGLLPLGRSVGGRGGRHGSEKNRFLAPPKGALRTLSRAGDKSQDHAHAGFKIRVQASWKTNGKEHCYNISMTITWVRV